MLVGMPVLAHSEKQDATATRKKTFGHHPLTGFVDHGAGGSGAPSRACCGRATRAESYGGGGALNAAVTATSWGWDQQRWNVTDAGGGYCIHRLGRGASARGAPARRPPG